MRREWAAPLVGILLLTGVVGSLWSVFDVARGRGVVIEAVAEDSPYRATLLRAGDAVWRVGGRRVSSTAEIDEEIRAAPTGQVLSLSAVSRGEHAEWAGFIVTEELKTRPQPSGLSGSRPTHRFRASGWTRHYQTYADILQMLANIALGFTLAFLARRRTDLVFRLALGAAAILLVGVALTAMRTALVAFSGRVGHGLARDERTAGAALGVGRFGRGVAVRRVCGSSHTGRWRVAFGRRQFGFTLANCAGGVGACP
jgi:hypothetical protein